MSLEKSIKSGNEHRKPYRGAKSFDKTCRNHGKCPWCRDDRLHGRKVAEERAKEKENEHETRNQSD